MKKHLRAKRFKSHDDMKPEVQTWLRGQDPTLYRQGFEKWITSASTEKVTMWKNK